MLPARCDETGVGEDGADPLLGAWMPWPYSRIQWSTLKWPVAMRDVNERVGDDQANGGDRPVVDRGVGGVGK